MHEFWLCDSDLCKNVIVLGFAPGPSLNLGDRLPRSSKHDENYYRWQQVLNGQYIKMSVNEVSMICGFVCTVIKQ